MTAPRLAVDDLTVRLSGRGIITHLDWTVLSGEFVALIGPNGVGKTTLLRAILGLIPRAGGNITVDGEHASRARGALGYVPQKHHFAWDFPLTVEDAVMNGRTRSMGWLRRPRGADWRRVNQAIERADLGRLRRRPIGELSGGQRQRVLLARVLAHEPKVLL
ncbi:MAG: ATP-binding cassette domain-containing protein, partial [Kocuria sp.]|nr:ATP-binding cassette domain-containing protein [Kocuria sp.]